MRKSWFLFVALAPLAATPALAATTVDNALTTPIATSSAGDVTITTSGSVTGSDTSPVVTLDSANTVSNAGTIQVNNVSGATGVLIKGGNTGGFTNTGAILLNEDFTAPDSNSDGVTEAPYAQGSGKVGVRLTGSSTFVGDITGSGTISVEGSDSKGISLEAPLQGTLLTGGAVTVVGDRGVGINVASPVAGGVRVDGPVSVQGMGSTGIDVSADVSGALSIYNGVSATGYGATTRPTVTDTLNKVQATASEVEQGGPAVHVGGSLGGGLYLGAPPPGTTVDTTTDADGDGIADNAVGTASIAAFGAAPAVLIGSSSRAIDLGMFGTGLNAYGVVLRGAVAGSGVYDGVSATGMQVGGLGGAVNIAGGIRVFGSLSANAIEASATALRIGSGATVPELRVENTITAVVNHSTVAATTTASGQATAVQIDAGANLPTITNIGNLLASATGDAVTAAAVVDQSGTVTNVVNQGYINVTVTPTTSGVSVAGKAVALDLRANTTGVTLTQSVNPSPIILAQTTTTTTTSPTAPGIFGDILLGSGPNSVTIDGGTIAGALDLGSGSAALTINNGATYKGELRHSGPALAIAVNAGNLYSTNAHPLQATSLTVGSTGVLSFAVDPQAGTAGGLQVSGAASFADGAKLGLSLASILTQPQTFTLIRASSLSVGASGVGLFGDTPYVVNASLKTDTAAGTVTLDLHRRTAAEAGFNAGEAAAYDGVYTALGLDAGIQGAILGQTTRDGFMNLYRQMLPEYAGGLFRLARAGAEATARSAAETEGAAGSLWLQEAGFGVDSSKSDAASYRGGGFGLVAGLDGPEGTLGRLGATLSFLAGSIEDPDSKSDGLESFSEFEAGLHWRLEAGGLRLDARGSGGLVSYKSKRGFLQTSATGTTLVERAATGEAKGYALSGRFGVGYEFGPAWLTVRPQTHLDYFRLGRKAYAETGGGDGFDLAIGERTGSMTSVTSSVVFTGGLGKSHSLHPSLELGYRRGLSGSAGTTTASFKGGSAFDLDAPAIKGQGTGVARLGLKSSKEYFDLSLTAGAEARADYLEGDLQFRARLAF